MRKENGNANDGKGSDSNLLRPLIKEEEDQKAACSPGTSRHAHSDRSEEKFTDRSDKSLLSFSFKDLKTSEASLRSARREGEGPDDPATSSSCLGSCFARAKDRCEKLALFLLFVMPKGLSVPLLEAVYGKRVSKEGVVMDSKIQMSLELIRTFKFEATDVVKKNRKKGRALFEKIIKQPCHEQVTVRDLNIPTEGGRHIGARIYTPNALVGSQVPCPVMVYYHGGGWVVGNLNTVEGILSWISHWSKCVVVSVDYRLAPEDPFPAAMDDALASFRWVSENAKAFGWDTNRLAVGGDSAGGNLAAVVSQQAVLRGFKVRPSFQVLLFPALYLGKNPFQFESIVEFGADPFYLLPGNAMRYYKDSYIGRDTDGEDIRMSPVMAEDALLKQLPPAYFFLCHFDVLRDEGRAYAKRLRENGVGVVEEEFNAHHGFIYSFNRLRFCKQRLKHIAIALRNHMYPAKL